MLLSMVLQWVRGDLVTEQQQQLSAYCYHYIWLYWAWKNILLLKLTSLISLYLFQCGHKKIKFTNMIPWDIVALDAIDLHKPHS